MSKYFSIVLMFVLPELKAQIFEDIRFLRDNDKIIIFYDLIDVEPGYRASVKLYSSLNNFAQPINKISGDISNVLPGPNRRIVWIIDEDYSTEINAIKFKLEGEVYPKFEMYPINSNNELIRGRKHKIFWQGGITEKKINLELIYPTQDTIYVVNIKNTGSYTWSTPKNIKTGGGYKIRLINDGIITEQNLYIKRRKSWIWLSIPIAGIIYYLASEKSDSNPSDLPNAPLPN